MARFPGFLAVQIEVLVPKDMTPAQVDALVPALRTQASTVVRKGSAHVLRGASGPDSKVDRVVVTCVPDTPNAPVTELARYLVARAVADPEASAEPAPAVPVGAIDPVTVALDEVTEPGSRETP